MSKELKCWSCKAVFTLSEHGNCDGCCWKCGVEIDLAEMDIQSAYQQGQQMACMPVERCYDVRAKMIIAFNEAKKAGGDLDDQLDAAYKSALRFSPNPDAQSASAKVDEDEEFEKAYQSVIDNGWTNVKHMARQVWQARAKLNTQQ
ncbi:hypothetical protein V2K91_05875 [Pseudomonas alliivorans]|nr:hypothetical protein [Pseudomonas alliivorans]